MRTDDDGGHGNGVAGGLHGPKKTEKRFTVLLAAVCALLLLTPTADAAPTWLPPKTFESNLGTEPDADVAVTPNGTAVAIWVASTAGDQRAKVSVRPPGQGFGPVTTLTPADGSDAAAPAVAVDNNGNATLAWQETAGPGGVQAIRAALVPPGGVVPTGAQTVSDAAKPSTDPVLGVGAGGTAVVAYTELDGPRQVAAAIRNAASGSFGAPADVSLDLPGATDPAPSVAVDDAGNAVVVWVQGSPVGEINVNQRSAGGGFGPPLTSVQPLSSAGLNASGPSVAMAPNETTVVVWSSVGPATDIRYNERTRSGTWLPDAKIASKAGVTAFNPHLAMDASGNAIAVWNATSGPAQFLQAGIRQAGGTFGSNFQDLTSTGGFNVDIAMNRAGDAIITYSGAMSELIGSVRRSRTGAFTGVIPAEIKPVSSTSSTALSNEGVGIDDEGNATGVWTRNLVPPNVWAVAAGAFDSAPPALSSSVPPGGTAGFAVPMAAAASDRLTPVSLNWTFGDGTTGVGGAISHVFGAAGAFNVSVTATDAVGNGATQTHPVLVAAPPPPPPPKDKRITSRVRATWGVAGKRIFLLRMQIGNVPKGAKAQLRCAAKKKARKCPFKRVSSKKRKKGTITLFKEIKAKKALHKKKRRFHAGQTLQVRITKKDFIGKVVRYKLEKGKIPSGKNLCLPAGKKKPRKRC